MSKNGTIIILNDIKKERDQIEAKYKKQKNKKITIKEKLIYILGFATLFCISCMFYPANLTKVILTLGTYSIGVPFVYSYIEFCKEQTLKKELEKINKKISEKEFEIEGIQVKKSYIENQKQFIANENIKNTFVENENLELENGPKLTLKK